jgi:hypothetical protein
MTGENEAMGSEGWYIAKWSPLAWLETLIKFIAILIGIAALANALSNGTFELPSGLRLVQFVVLGILCLGLVAAIFDRLSRREIVSMVFVLFNNLGHWGLLIALAFVPRPAALLVYFSVLMVGGDLVKLASFKADNFTQSGVSPATLYALTGFYIVGYAILLVLEWLL